MEPIFNNISLLSSNISGTSQTGPTTCAKTSSTDGGQIKNPISNKLNRRIISGIEGSYVPNFPLSILHIIVEANAVIALPLVMAIYRQLRMKRCPSTPLTAAIWRASGSPSTKKREVILRKLKALPEIFHIEIQRTPNSYYRISFGEIWESKTDKFSGRTTLT